MTIGRVNWLLEAIVHVEVQDASGNIHRIRCILDTGFDRDIALPLGIIERLGLDPVETVSVTLADSTHVLMTRYNARVSWQGQLIEVDVLETNGESAIGMALLENSILSVQVWDGGEVLIEERA